MAIQTNYVPAVTLYKEYLETLLDFLAKILTCLNEGFLLWIILLIK